MDEATLELRGLLEEPFDPSELKWKPQTVKGNRALAICYVDARVVMDRLDDVFGVGGWQTNYSIKDDGVVCRLRVRVNGEWVEHEDFGGYSEQPDEGDKKKAAFSDALKRAAIHLGIGRYLYRMPRSWADYDEQKKCITKPPPLPDFALPRRREPAPQQQKPVEQPKPAEKKPEPAATPQPAPQKANGEPINGAELVPWLESADAKAVAELGVAAGWLSEEVVKRVRAAHKDANKDCEKWNAPLVKVAVGAARTVYAEAKERAAKKAAEPKIDPASPAGQVLAQLKRCGFTWEDALAEMEIAEPLELATAPEPLLKKIVARFKKFPSASAA